MRRRSPSRDDLRYAPRARRRQAAGGGSLLALVVAAAALLFGLPGGGSLGLPDSVRELPQATGPATGEAPLEGAPRQESDLFAFLRFVVGDVNDFWEGQFGEAGQAYQRAPLIIFDEAVQTACGPATEDVGPFYCPLDQRAYLEPEFFVELERRFGASGDFAQAYVIAHEIGHHVQRLTGVDRAVRAEQQANPGAANQLSVLQELQADCFAGVWAHSTYERDLLEAGDLEEGLGAAAAVGDDRIQAQTTGRVNPETWTHGSAAQRREWFSRGFESGAPSECDTFESAGV